MEYRVLGPVEVLADGRPVAIGGPKPRSLLVLLLLNAGRVVPTTQVIEALWGGRPPMSGATRVQGVVSQLRASFGPSSTTASPTASRVMGPICFTSPSKPTGWTTFMPSSRRPAPASRLGSRGPISGSPPRARAAPEYSAT
jgi:hypothetical protein